MDWIEIDWNQVILLLIGTIIGTIGSALTILIQSVSEKAGKLTIYTKFICLKNMGQEGWGIFQNPEGGLSLLIPAVFEIENTSKRARVMRDVSIVLLNGNTIVAKMTQIDYLQTTSRRNNQVTKEEEHFYGDEKGSYSFVVEPVSIKRENCVYLYKIEQSEKKNKDFNAIGLQYFDEKNKRKILKIRNYTGWDIQNNSVDIDWIYVNEKA